MPIAKKGLWGATTVLALFAIAGCGADPAAQALATVNGQAITAPQWKQSMEAVALLSGESVPSVTAATKKAQVKELMQWSAVEQWALSHHLITKAKALSDAKAAVSSIEKEAGTTAELKDELKSYHLTLPEFSNFMVDQEMLEAAYTHVTKSVKAPTTAAEKSFYKSNGTLFAEPATDEVRAILVKTDAEATTIEQEITSGADSFATLAKKDSLDKTSAKSGGDLGTLTLTSNGYPPKFTAEMKSLKAGQYGIADTVNGYYVMEVEKVNPASEESFSSVKSEIESQLEETDDSDAFTSFGEKVLAKAKTHLYLK
jgi:parvulin-like peptidyl-prolyl isomerase